MVCSCSVVGFSFVGFRKRGARSEILSRLLRLRLCLFFFQTPRHVLVRSLSLALLSSFLSRTHFTDRRSLVDAILPLAGSERVAKDGFESAFGESKEEEEMKNRLSASNGGNEKQGEEEFISLPLFLSFFFTSNDGVRDRARRRRRRRVRGRRSRGAGAVVAVGRQRDAEDSVAIHRCSFFIFLSLSLSLSLSLFSLLPLALSTQRGVPCCCCCYRESAPVLSPPRKRGRRGGSSGHREKKEELKTKKKICETRHPLSSARVFFPLPLVYPHSPPVAALMPRDLLLEAPRGAISFLFFYRPKHLLGPSSPPSSSFLLLSFIPSP